jgi:uncharacterized membrane protein
MLFSPIGCLILILFIFLFQVLFISTIFNIVNFSFKKLGFSQETTFLILILILLGSIVNIPLTKKKIIYRENKYFFGFFKRSTLEYQGIAINLGGAVIPILISIYLLTKIPWQGTLTTTIFMVIFCYSLSKIIPGRGIVLPAFIPPIFSALLALIFASGFAAPTAFVSGVLGTLIGADILKLKKIQKISPGMVSIGGAGVFDGIFFVGIVSVLLTSF